MPRDPAQTPPATAQAGPARILRRHVPGLDLAVEGLSRFLGGVVTPDERRRYLFGAGSRASAIEMRPALGRAVCEGGLEMGGSVMVTAHDGGPLAHVAAPLPDLPLIGAEPGLFAGLNVVLGSRIDESAAQVAEWLGHLARQQGATGALVIDRAPPDDRAPFDKALGAALAGIGLVVVMLEFGLPLGKPGEPAQNHPINAPGAPGRARMETPDPDPWRAPLGEPLVYEFCKWAFLSDARAVLALDVGDILAPGAANAFDACLQAPGGCVALSGTQIYPWRLRAGQEARLGDHVYLPFDATGGPQRWGVAPRRAGLGRPWRLVRISGMVAEGGTTLPFLRAMAIRFPGQPTARLVPKTSLIEDANLVAMARRDFGHSPLSAPAGETAHPAPAEARQPRTAIVTTMKNEGPFLLEWIAYHRAIGVTGFLVYTNDCTDGTDSFLQLLQDKGICQHRANPWKPGGTASPQYAALAAASDEEVMRSADWLICMDVDEFINVKIGDGTLGALYAAIGGANMVSLTWRLFGNAEVVAYEDRPIIAQFDRCAPEVIRKPHQAWGFKTLFRNDEIFRKMGVHRPKGLRPEMWERISWLNGSGQPMPVSILRNGWRSTVSTYGYDWVQLNHYAVRSVESFLVKRDRGRVNHTDRDQGKNYWFRMNHNLEEDRTIQRMLPRLEAEMARLLADPDIRAAHDHSVACHRAKIAELMAREDQRDLYAELTGERMVRLCRMQQHFGSAVFSAGPHVIPDEIALNRDLKPDFFFTVEHAGEANH